MNNQQKQYQINLRFILTIMEYKQAKATWTRITTNK